MQHFSVDHWTDLCEFQCCKTWDYFFQLAKLDKLPRQEEFTMEMFNDYFPWTKMKNGETHKLFPFTKASQPENLTLNDSEMINNLLSKVGINVKV